MKPDEAIEVSAPLFSMELDGSDFERFDRYKRWFVEHEKRARMAKTSPRVPAARGRATVAQVLRNLIDSERKRNPEFVKRYPELEDPAVLSEIARKLEAESVASGKKAAKERKMQNSKLLARFDACRFDGPDDWVYRRTFKEALREVLVEYFSDTRTGGHRGSRLVRAGGFERSMVSEALSWKALRSLQLLRTLAEGGDNKALQLLAEIVIPLVKVVNARAVKDPAALGSMPQRFQFWPALKSGHASFDEDHQKLLKELRVGQNYPLFVGGGRRWKAQDAAGQWAIHLCQEVYIMQDGHCEEDPPKAWEKILLQLRPFSEASWKDWWTVARGVLHDEYIDVVEIPELRNTVKSKADLRSPGRVRKRILQALKDKFKSMAGGNKL